MPAFNPYLPSWEYIPDGEPRLFNGRVYVYGSHDLFNGAAFCMGDYVGWSAAEDDLSAWRCEGVIYRREQDPACDKGYMYAPDVVRGTDGRYYLYYSMSGDKTVSVAVCDEPAGEYRFLGHVVHPDGTPIGRKTGDVNNFDPGVLVDDDGRVYLYVGFAPKGQRSRAAAEAMGLKCDGGYVMELAGDMLTAVTAPVRTIPGIVDAVGTPFEDHAYFEASSIRKIGGRYNLIWSSVLSHELCYAWSDSPMGPFTFGGVVVSIVDMGFEGNREQLNHRGNTHGGLVQACSQWYVFYHRQTNRSAFSRQACAEKVTILPDGRIPQVEVTSCGLNGGPLPGCGAYEARIACNLGGKTPLMDEAPDPNDDTEPYFTQSGEDRQQEGDQYIAGIPDGGWCAFKYFAYTGNEKRIRMRVRCTGEGVLTISHARNGAPVSLLTLPTCGQWTEVAGAFTPQEGRQPLYFMYHGTGAADFSAFEVE